MDALTAATLGLVLATVVVAIVGALQARQMRSAAGEARRQTAVFADQARALQDTLEVSRETLAEIRAERASAMPLEVSVDLTEAGSGIATFLLRNGSPAAVMRLDRLVIRELPDGPVIADNRYAEHTLAVGATLPERWPWDASHVGRVLSVEITGCRLGGPIVTAEQRFRIAPDGRLDDLREGPGPFVMFA